MTRENGLKTHQKLVSRLAYLKLHMDEENGSDWVGVEAEWSLLTALLIELYI